MHIVGLDSIPSFKYAQKRKRAEGSANIVGLDFNPVKNISTTQKNRRFGTYCRAGFQSSQQSYKRLILFHKKTGLKSGPTK